MYYAMGRWMAIRLEASCSAFYLALTLIVVFVIHAGKADEAGLNVDVLGVALIQLMSLGITMQYAIRMVCASLFFFKKERG